MRLAEAAGALVCGHTAVSLFGIGNAIVARPPPRPKESTTQADAINKVVSAMYQGSGLDMTACSETVTFTDPAARCSGKAEVAEAFRALKACTPQHVDQPAAVAMPDGSVHLHLHQRYSIIRSFTIKSVLVVRMDSDGRVCELEERWNGAKLLDFAAFRFSRRVNGILSALLTPVVFPQ